MYNLHYCKFKGKCIIQLRFFFFFCTSGTIKLLLTILDFLPFHTRCVEGANRMPVVIDLRYSTCLFSSQFKHFLSKAQSPLWFIPICFPWPYPVLLGMVST